MTEKIKHILIVVSEFPPLPGGIGNHAHNLAKHLTLQGYQVSVLTDQRHVNLRDDLVFDAEQNYKVYRVPVTNPRFPMYFSRLLNLVKLSKSVDLVLATGKFSLWAVAFLSWFRKIKTLAVIHGTEVNFKVKWTKKLVSISLKCFDQVVAVSKFTKDLVDPLKLKHLEVIPNGFTLSSVATQSVPVKLSGNPKLLTVGNVTERKGQHEVIKHLPKLLQFYPELHYHCVGLDTETSTFLKLAAELGVSKHVSFHGFVDNQQLPNYYKASDVFVMLSTQTASGDVEGFGIALLEANALGVPCIGSKGSGIEDAICHEQSGLLISGSDSDAFLGALKDILENRNAYSKNAKEWAEEHRWEKIIMSYTELLN